MHNYVYYSIKYYCQEIETTKMSRDRQMNKEVITHIHNIVDRILYCHKKKMKSHSFLKFEKNSRITLRDISQVKRTSTKYHTHLWYREKQNNSVGNITIDNKPLLIRLQT